MRFFIFTFMFISCLKAEEVYAYFDVYAMNQSFLAMETAGVVKQIFVKPSQLVKKGDVLLELENSSEKIALQLAKNDYELALTELNNSKSKLSKFSKVKDVLDSQSFEDMQDAFEEARLKAKKAELNIKRYEDALEKKTLKAPYDAIVANKFINVGEGVSPTSQKLFEIFSYPQVKLLLSFDEKYKDKVKIGQTYRYKVANEEKEAKIDLIYPSIDVKNRKIYAEAYTTGLTVGLFGEGSIIIK
ncbi:efflux RND transporter periplasmic adaptor subunit [Campylobacter avium]|uniref:efflux RND transporter periplasmic adaptor subunit n=2 Tax=Campylobacter TaxID=194 RepID=UPI003B59833C